MNDEFVLLTDAYGHGISGVLSEYRNGVEKLVAIYS